VKLLFAGLFVVITLPAAVAAPTVAISTVPRPAPAAPLFASVPAGGYPDRFPYGQCTWWAAYTRHVTWSGNAGDWLANAQAQGGTTNSTPSVGAIAVYRPGGGYSDLYGHVAVVIAVGPGTYTVSEMNFIGWGQVSTRTVGWPDPHIVGFIPVREED
jgi:surface antigen